VLHGYHVDKDLYVVDHVDNSITVYVENKKDYFLKTIFFRILMEMLLIVGKVFVYNVYMSQMMELF
jgi:hypothetical protein